MRQLTDHIVSGDQAVQLQIEVTDEPGQGGANHAYRISWDKTHATPSREELDNGVPSPELSPVLYTLHRQTLGIQFQNGPIKLYGVNGITHEALLAIVIDRLRGFQGELGNDGPFRCRENAIALTYCEEALMWLQRRTVARIKRGVEGTNEK